MEGKKNSDAVFCLLGVPLGSPVQRQKCICTCIIHQKEREAERKRRGGGETDSRHTERQREKRDRERETKRDYRHGESDDNLTRITKQLIKIRTKGMKRILTKSNQEVIV